MTGPGLDADQLEQLQVFLRDWLRHCGRTQADLRRALRAASIRMPVLVDALHRVYRHEGVSGLAGTLCAIEAGWQEGAPADNAGPDDTGPDVDDAFGQLDLLLAEIREDLSLS